MSAVIWTPTAYMQWMKRQPPARDNIASRRRSHGAAAMVGAERRERGPMAPTTRALVGRSISKPAELKCVNSWPRIAFVSTCKGRLMHLRETLPKNIADNADYDNCVFVVLAYGDGDVCEYVRTFHGDAIASGRLVVYTYRNGDAPFHVAHAKNIAARCGIRERADILVTLDADNFTGRGFAHFVADNFREPSIRRNSYLAPDFAAIPKPGAPGVRRAGLPVESHWHPRVSSRWAATMRCIALGAARIWTSPGVWIARATNCGR